MGRALTEEPPISKLEFREKKCLRILENFSKSWKPFLGENGELYIGIWPALLGE